MMEKKFQGQELRRIKVTIAVFRAKNRDREVVFRVGVFGQGVQEVQQS